MSAFWGYTYSTTTELEVSGAAYFARMSDVVSVRPDNIAGNSGLSFTLSRGNSIYGASDTVMPASANMAAGIYLGQTA